MALAGAGGRIPRDFLFLDVCEKYSQKPTEMEEEPAFCVERMKFKLATERQAEADRAANDKARREAGIK